LIWNSGLKKIDNQKFSSDADSGWIEVPNRDTAVKTWNLSFSELNIFSPVIQAKNEKIFVSWFRIEIRWQYTLVAGGRFCWS
jgi:hypothetical protein